MHEMKIILCKSHKIHEILSVFPLRIFAVYVCVYLSAKKLDPYSLNTGSAFILECNDKHDIEGNPLYHVYHCIYEYP